MKKKPTEKTASKKATKKTSKKKVSRSSYIYKAVKKTFNASEPLFNNNGGFSPIIFVDFEWMSPGLKGGSDTATKDASLMILLADEEIMEARRYLMASLGAAAATIELLGLAGPARSVRLASEAWVSKQNEVRPSEDPNHIEALTVSGEDSKGSVASVSKEIIRQSHVPDEGDIEVEVTLRDLPEMDVVDGFESPLLDNFWNTQRGHYKTMKKDGQYAQFIDDAQQDPEKILQMIVDTAIKSARLHYTQEQGKGGVSKM